MPKPGQATVLVVELDSLICPFFHALLTQSEHDACARFIHQKDRHGAQVMRGLARLCASVLAQRAPHELELDRTPYGRPEIVGMDRDDCDFNVSRTGSCCAAILTRGARCGIDIEDADPTRVTADLIGQLWAPGVDSERKLVTEDDFYRRWTQTEAALKADGRGLNAGLDLVSFPDRVSSERGECRIGPKTWYLRPIPMPVGVVASCAFDDACAEIVQVAQSQVWALI